MELSASSLSILPPLFIVAGLAVGWLFSQKLRHLALQVLAALLLLAPGLAALPSCTRMSTSTTTALSAECVGSRPVRT